MQTIGYSCQIRRATTISSKLFYILFGAFLHAQLHCMAYTASQYIIQNFVLGENPNPIQEDVGRGLSTLLLSSTLLCI